MAYDNYPTAPDVNIYMLERGLRTIAGAAAEYLSVPQGGTLLRVDGTIGDTLNGDVVISIRIDGEIDPSGTATIPSGSDEGYSFTIPIGKPVENYIKMTPTPGTNTVAAKCSLVCSIKR